MILLFIKVVKMCTVIYNPLSKVLDYSLKHRCLRTSVVLQVKTSKLIPWGFFIKRGSKMEYPIAIEPVSNNYAFGVVVPDLPGCFSAGDTLIEAINNAKEAIELWMQTVIDDGGDVPDPN